MPLASTAYSRPLDPRFAGLATRETLAALAPSERVALAASLAEALGGVFSAESELAGAAGLPVLVHRPTAMRFIVVVGGEMVMGMRPEEIDAVSALYAPLGRADEAREHVSWATQPPRKVRVRPFLCAARPITDRLAHMLLEDILHGDDATYVPKDEPVPFEPRIAAELRGALGMRLLAEAEWEWMAREGGVRTWLGAPPRTLEEALDPAWRKASRENAFGFDFLRDGLEFVADAWHKGYEGAPADAVAWEPRAVPDHGRGCPKAFPDELEATRLCAGVREGRLGDELGAVRFAIDLP